MDPDNAKLKHYLAMDNFEGVLYTWPVEEIDDTIYDKAFLLDNGAIKIIE